MSQRSGAGSISTRSTPPAQSVSTTTVTATTVTADDLEVDSGTLSIDEANNRVGMGTASPQAQLHVSKDTDGEFVALKLTNESDANDTTGKVSLQFDLEDTGGNAVDAAKLLISKEAAFTATASTQDAKLDVQLTENGTLGTKFTVESSGDIVVVGDVEVADGKAVVDSNNAKILKFCENGSAVNYIEIENAADGASPAISALGDSSNINVSIKPKGTGGVRVYGTAAAAATLYLNEDTDNGTNFMGIRANAAIGTSHTYTFPAALPASDKVLQSDSSGNLSWEDELERNDLSLILHMQVFS